MLFYFIFEYKKMQESTKKLHKAFDCSVKHKTHTIFRTIVLALFKREGTINRSIEAHSFHILKLQPLVP